MLGLRSENASHRIAVEWDTAVGIRTGVYIPRRDTGSGLNAWERESAVATVRSGSPFT
ncbi:MAG: hypothetical protein QOJ29_399 [Thermoleophilaceae bacterium]|nr:hypothetical protein [Thermoleophilaceae bacterium]